VISFSNRANLFLRVCPIHFYDICNQHELTSGCGYGKVSGIELCLVGPQYVVTKSLSDIVEIDIFNLHLASN